MSGCSLLTSANDPYLLFKTQQLPLFLRVSMAGEESLSLSKSIDPSKQRLCLPGSDGALLRVCKAQKALSLGSLLVIQGSRQRARGFAKPECYAWERLPMCCVQNLGVCFWRYYVPILSSCWDRKQQQNKTKTDFKKATLKGKVFIESYI